MPERSVYPEGDPRRHAARTRVMLEDLANHTREEGRTVTEPKARALFETTAEVLLGLATAYDHYEKRSEEAWR